MPDNGLWPLTKPAGYDDEVHRVALEEHDQRVEELTRWHTDHDQAVLAGASRSEAIAIADGGSPTVKRDALREEIAELRDAIAEFIEIRNKAAAAAERARDLIKEVRETIRVVVPNPAYRDSFVAVATTGRDVDMRIPTESQWVEVYVTPHELREFAMRKAGLLREPGNGMAVYDQHGRYYGWAPYDAIGPPPAERF